MFGKLFAAESLTSKEAMLFWLKVEYLAIPYISFLLLLVVMHFAGLNSRIHLGQTWYLLIVPVITMFLSITHEYHEWYYKDVTLDTSTQIPLLNLQFGPWYYVHVIYSYLLILYGVVVLGQKIYYQRSLFRNQLLFMLIAVIIPLVTFTIYFAGLMPVKNIDPTPFAFALSGLSMSVGIFKFRMFDLMPIAREHIFRSMGDAVVVIDNKQRFVDCNPVALKIFSWKKTPYGVQIENLWTEYPKLLSECVLGKETSWEFEITGNESRHYYFTTISDIRNHKQIVVGEILVIHDITHRHLMQETIVRSEEKLRLLNAEKDKLFSIIAHDLRGPIGAFINLTELFMDDSFEMSSDEMKGIAKDMNKSAQSLQSLLENLLNWSRMQRQDVVIQKSTVEIRPLVDKAIDLMRESIANKTLYVKNAVPDGITVYADENMLQTVLRNLISNAIKFTPKGGNILIQAERKEYESVTIKIRDTGIGMSPEMIQNLYRFDKKTSRFGTEGESSSGLGLMLCKEFIEKNDGQLFVESQVDKGTTFSFHLPVGKPSEIE
ncbi:MAG: histidine kinase N-terminal 7TM domain-containing protein [Bacteroidales bacterium]|nr:histidine kinase N-terminal 7TM domain-containing protein [Bacteroidales bacterium]